MIMADTSNVKELYKLIDDSIDVVSFDFFDTLYIRPICDPEDIFDLVGIRLEIENFRDRRRHAQVLGFQKMHAEGRREVTIDDIYSCFDLPADLAETCKRLEIALELELTVPNPEMIDFFRYCLERKRVVVISDMYLGRSFFEELLGKHGLKVEDIFVSAELNMTKRDTGEIFDHVARSMGVPSGRILHVGDSAHSDVMRGGEKGFRTFHYAETRKPFPRPGQSFASSLATALHRCALPSRTDRFYEYGYRYGGAALVAFVDFIRQKAKEDQIDLLLFVSRDGFILHEVTNGTDTFTANTAYLKGSRTAFTLSALTEENFESFLPFLLSGSFGLSPHELFERIDVTPPADEVLTDLGFSGDVRVTRDNLSEMAVLLRAFRWQILMRCRESRRGLYNYLFQLGMRSGMRVALVDVGWSGTTLDAFQKAIDGMFDVQLSGYFLCLVNSAECRERRARLNMRALLDVSSLPDDALKAIYRSRVAAELMFSAPHPSVVGYRVQGGAVLPVEDEGRGKSPVSNEATESMLLGMREYYDTFNEVRDRIGLPADGVDTLAPFVDFMTNMPDDIKQSFSAIRNFDAWASSKNFDMKASEYMA